MEVLIWMPCVILLYFDWKQSGAVGHAKGKNENLNLFGRHCCLLIFGALLWSLRAIWPILFDEGILGNYFVRNLRSSCTKGLWIMEHELFGTGMKAAVDRNCSGNCLRTCSQLWLTDLMMTTPARITDLAIVWNVDDRAMMTNDVMTINHSSELSCISDVASSICEKNHPRARDLGTKRTCEQCLEGNARPQRRRDGVVNICTKCIQFCILCLIIVSIRSVLRVTASSSLLYFHLLFLYLFYRGDLRYYLYFRYRFFYNLYKVQMMEVFYYGFLLDKNGSILE